MPQGLIPREKIKPSPITAFLFYFSLIVLMGSVAVTVWLQFKVNPLKKKFEENKILISKIKTPEDEVIEKEMLEAKKTLKDFWEVFEKRKVVSRFFVLLENTTHPQVFFDNMNLNVKDGKLRLDGHTENFRDLGEQMLLQRENKFVEDVKLRKVSFNKTGGIDFSLELLLNPKIFLPAEGEE
ncbi:hypothetical protein J7J81_02490 [bacterium]|nr:hypothetical protein [bacterium]